MQTLLRHRLGLLRGVRADQKRAAHSIDCRASHFFFAEQGVGSSTGRTRNRCRFAKRFFPRSDPIFVYVTVFIARIVQHYGGFFPGRDGGPKQRPKRPVSAVKSSQQNVRKRRRTISGPFECTPIGGVDQFETAFRKSLLKQGGNLTQGGKFNRGKIPAGRSELINRSKQVVGRTGHGFGGEKIGLE